MPASIAFYELHAEHRDQFEIIAIHDASVQSMKAVDLKTKEAVQRYWNGKDLPFPIALDKKGETEKLFSISGHPTCLLIDPEGKVLDEDHQCMLLGTKLPPVSLAKKLASAKDLFKNAVYKYDQKTTFNQLKNYFSQSLMMKVEFDAEALKAIKKDENSLVDCFLQGYSISIRSQEEALLWPLGLGFEVNKDGKSLLITKRTIDKKAENTQESYLQKQAVKLLEESLAKKVVQKGSASIFGQLLDNSPPKKPLKFDNTPLSEALEKINVNFQVNVGVDTAFLLSKAIDLNQKVSGVVDPDNLGESIANMLKPIGLKYVIKHEVVWITKE